MVEQVAVQRWSDCISGLADWRVGKTGELKRSITVRVYRVANAATLQMSHRQTSPAASAHS